ncbi:MAG TPA: aldehyde dehydrogenase family protein [Saprospiraceae bacterium]|nr:aldehyde dehydrogenase family protein [Saprospiraceae bacterium]
MNYNYLNQEEIKNIFEKQRSYAAELKKTGVKKRKAKLQSVLEYLSQNEIQKEIIQAIWEDMRRHEAEAYGAEIVAVIGALKHLKRNLDSWLKPKKVPTPLPFLGTKSYIMYEPKGSALIISPWNYPVQLSIVPMLYAIAAGNTVIIKPSEFTPASNAVVKKLVSTLFNEKEVAVVEGAVKETTSLLSMPFDHIYFTGSTAVGKIVMEAAAKNLSSVTLELGGKSPCIVDESADIKTSVQRIAWAKLYNAGQTCISVDHLFVHESIVDPFVRELVTILEKVCPSSQADGGKRDVQGRLITEKHYLRSKALLQDAVDKGARVLFGGVTDDTDRYMEPVILDQITLDMKIMQDEIFCPILPVIPYSDPEEVVRDIRRRPKPLSMYIFSNNKKNIQYFLSNTTAGGGMINDTLIHLTHNYLPFGGVNQSGLGKTNGFYGLMEFMNERGIMEQKLGLTRNLLPPYGKKTMQTLRIIEKYLL